MKRLEYKQLSNDKLLHRYYVAQNSGGFFLKQEIPKLHKEMLARGMI